MISYFEIQVTTALCSYLIGSIPTGYWYAKYLYNIDITKHGSKNMGATNCARVLGGFKHFLIIMILDASKSFVTLSIVQLFFPNNITLLLTAAVCLLLGNSFSCFLSGNGGKGVSTLVGITFFLEPVAILVAAPFWIIIKKISQSSALASTCSVGIIPLYYYFYNQTPDHLLAFFFTSAACWVILRHKSNLYTYLESR